jgi:hypothetical protein
MAYPATDYADNVNIIRKCPQKQKRPPDSARQPPFPSFTWVYDGENSCSYV